MHPAADLVSQVGVMSGSLVLPVEDAGDLLGGYPVQVQVDFPGPLDRGWLLRR
jgi:hypothetical protein